MNNKVNFKKVFLVFKENYVEIPLEVYGKDPYKTLISTLLSSRTKDEITLSSSQRLFKKATDIKSLNKLSENEIVKLIYPVGFYKTKAKHLKKTAKIILSKYKGQIPNKRNILESLPGVGRKTANLVLNRAFGKPAIAVDTHVHKISNLLGWVKTDTPTQTEAMLTKIIPVSYWKDLNKLFVSIGRQFTSKNKLKNFLIKNDLIKQS